MTVSSTSILSMFDFLYYKMFSGVIFSFVFRNSIWPAKEFSSPEELETSSAFTYFCLLYTSIPRTEIGKFLKEKDFKAVNVTIPYKREVIPFLDEISKEAKAIGSVNCIRNDEGWLIGHNTDFDGLSALADYAGIDMREKKVLILGTGGTSDTALAVAKMAGASEVYKVSRRAAGSDRVLGRDEAPVVTYEDARRLCKDAEVIINTTPCGMYPNIFSKAIDLEDFKRLDGVLDVVYNPLSTMLIAQARSMGIKGEGGLYMLSLIHI